MKMNGMHMDTVTHTPVDVQASAMGALLAAEDKQPKLPKVGDLIEGRILSVSKSEVHVDIDGITTGVVRGRELFDESGDSANLKIGDLAQATVLELENEGQEMELSFRTAGHQKAWTELQELFESKRAIDVPIVEANRGGLMVRVGRVEGFLPVSQLTTEHYPRVEGGEKTKILEKLQSYVGQSFKVKLLDINEVEDKLIVSEKAAWEEKHREKLDKYHVGETVSGKVTGVVDFGAFVEFDEGLEGLVHISELAWQRVEDPHDIVKVGSEVVAKIIGIEGNKISLSMKQLTEDPWIRAVEKYQVGQEVEGKVTKLNPFGAFVELDPDIHGLAHISELSKKSVSHPGDIVKINETYTFTILSIEPRTHRLGLTLKKPGEADEAPAELSNEDPLAEKPSDEAPADSAPTPEASEAVAAPDESTSSPSA
jgi:small subunit ribosomal protein S1